MRKILFTAAVALALNSPFPARAGNEGGKTKAARPEAKAGKLEAKSARADAKADQLNEGPDRQAQAKDADPAAFKLYRASPKDTGPRI